MSIAVSDLRPWQNSSYSFQPPSGHLAVRRGHLQRRQIDQAVSTNEQKHVNKSFISPLGRACWQTVVTRARPLFTTLRPRLIRAKCLAPARQGCARPGLNVGLFREGRNWPHADKQSWVMDGGSADKWELEALPRATSATAQQHFRGCTTFQDFNTAWNKWKCLYVNVPMVASMNGLVARKLGLQLMIIFIVD